MPDDPGRSHDTDPLADTQAPGEGTNPSSAETSRLASTQRRSVHSGDTLGRYELVEDVGEGGMATVYRARDKELRRDVAVKVLFPHLARRDEVVRRFHREARAAAGLEHANILRVYDVGGGESPDMERGGFTSPRENDPPFIVMELIRGHSLLGEVERRGPLLAELTACIGALLADALSVAHKAGIIHRDVKPANVMIDTKGRVLLADFGVARLETEDSLVTKTGALLGTPAYMSPEQASGDTATARSDLYSLGATLYQVSTGHLPYTGSPAKVLAQIAQGSLVSAVRKRAAVGPDLSRVIDRMMATDPEARPATAIEVVAELRAIASASGFGEPAEEVAAYFTDSEAFAKQKVPVVVAALIASAKRAISDNKPPRAMALAGRASELAPGDPAVAEIIDTITEGGRASRRRRVLAIAGLGMIAAGGATFGAMQLLGDSETRRDNIATAASDASNSPEMLTAHDAHVIAASDDAAIERIVDAGVVASRPRDAGVAIASRRVDAAVARITVDAGVTQVDAAVQVATSPPASAFLVIKTDSWCDVTIDNLPRGRASTRPLAVEPGKHTVSCAQSATGKSWTQHVEVGAGKTETVQGSLRDMVDVTLEVDATLDGKAYPRGQVVRIKADRYELVVGGTKTRVDIRRSCRVRSTPEVGCY